MIVSFQIEGLLLGHPEPKRWRRNRIEDWSLNSNVVHEMIDADREGLDVESFTLLGQEFSEDAERRFLRDRVPGVVRYAPDKRVLWDYERGAFIIHRDLTLEIGFYVDDPNLFDLYQALTRY